MDDRVARLEARVEELSRAVEGLAGRMAAVEEDRAFAAEVAPPAAPAEAGRVSAEVAPLPLPGPLAVEDRWGPVALLGRTLMVLGGAYLFRALTEAGAVPPAGGVALGLAYALLWLALADRAAGRGRRLSASFHGAAFALIAAPLVWEAAARFRVLSALPGAALLAALTGMLLAVAWRRDLRAVAWLGSLAAALSAWAFMGSLEPVLPAAFVLVLVAVADDWVAYARGWRLLPWVTALAADATLAFMVLGELLGARAAGREAEVAALAALLVALFVLCAGSAAARAARSGWRPRWIDLFQVPAAAALGYGGAFLLVRRIAGVDPAFAWGLGAGSLAAGLASLAAMRALFPRRVERRSSYLLFSWLGLLLVLGGTALLLPRPLVASGWALLGVGAAFLASRHGSVTLGLHAGVYGLAAAWASGLLVHAGHALAAPAATPWPELRPAAVVTLAALAVAASLRLAEESAVWGRAGVRVSRLLLLGVLAWGALGALAAAATGAFLGVPGTAGPGAVDPGALALLRMVLVAGAALSFAWLGRFRRYREAVWLVYPVLVVGGFKLVLEDFLLGRAAELFAALGIYGAVLIVAPRLARSSRGGAPARPGGAEAALAEEP